MAKKFADLAAPLYASAEGRARIDELTSELRAETIAHQLAQLRTDLGLTQIELANRLGITQGGLSQIERSADLKISTLRKLVEALGGTLRIEVALPDHTVTLSS